MKKVLCVLLLLGLLSCTTRSRNDSTVVSSNLSKEETNTLPNDSSVSSMSNGSGDPNVESEIVKQSKETKETFEVKNNLSSVKNIEKNKDLYTKKKANLGTGFLVDTFSTYYGNYTLLLKIPNGNIFSSKSDKELAKIERKKLAQISKVDHYFALKGYSTIESKELSPNLDIDLDLPNLLSKLNLEEKLDIINNKILVIEDQLKSNSLLVNGNSENEISSSLNSVILEEDTKELEVELNLLKQEQLHLINLIDQQRKEYKKQLKYQRDFNLADSYLNNNLKLDYTRENLKNIYLSDVHLELLKNFTANLNPMKQYIAVINVLGTPVSKWFDDNMKLERTVYTQYVYDYFFKNFSNIRVEKRYINDMPEDHIFIVLASYEGEIPQNIYNAEKGNILEWLTSYQELEKEQQVKAEKFRQELENEVSFPKSDAVEISLENKTTQ